MRHFRAPAPVRRRTFAGRRSENRSIISRLFQPNINHNRDDEDGPPAIAEGSDDDVEEDCQSHIALHESVRNYCLFDSVVSRGPPMEYNLLSSYKNADRLARLNDTNSTAVDLAQWLEHQSLNERTMSSPWDRLFNIICGDTLEVTHLMHSALSEIGHDILDDTIIQNRLLHWRHFLENLDVGLRQLQDSLQDFIAFLVPLNAAQQNTSSSRAEAGSTLTLLETRLKVTLKEISDLRQRAISSDNSLMANMNIIESKRGIAEAESVTKLTELAFLFIPLTFSASIFGMQVRELTTANVSIWAFFLLAVCITFGSYGLRLLIRSESVIRMKQRSLEVVRNDAELAPGYPIPTRYFVAWIWNRIGLHIIFVSLLIALLVSPIVPLWMRSTITGFTTVITILILTSELTASYFVANLILYSDSRGVHFNPDLVGLLSVDMLSMGRGELGGMVTR